MPRRSSTFPLLRSFLQRTRAPQPRSLVGPYGKYQLAISTTSDGYKVERALARFPLAVPAAEYEELRAFFEAVREADAVPLTFARSES